MYFLGGAEGNNKDSLNYLFTVVKKYVYNTKCKEKLLSIEGVTITIRHYHTLEHWIVKNEYGSVRGYSDKSEQLSSINEPLEEKY